MNSYVIVALGAAFGGALRHGCNGLASRLFGTALPYGTFLINVGGSFAMGVLAAWFALRGAGSAGGSSLRLFLATGVLGGFTTFSAFSLEVALMHQRGQVMLSFAYALASVIVAVTALFAGLALARQLL